MSHSRRLSLLLLAALPTLLAAPAWPRPPALRWEKMHVFHALPSVVFARLGLTHSTRNGYTRDGKQGIPDPSFPPGLTDVVPYDTDRLLLVRGSVEGLSLFRARVMAADVPLPPRHLKAELTRRSDAEGTPPAALERDAVQDGVPTQISLGEGEAARVYQIKTHANPDGSVWIACRIRLPLPPPSAPSGVFVPDQVWTDPASRRVKLGETAVFDDRAADRQAAGRKLGATGPDTPDDYTLRVTLTPMPAAMTQP